MAVESHLKQLLDRHSKLDRQIHQVELTSTDDVFVHRMKKQKLKLKEEIESIKLHTKPQTSLIKKDKFFIKAVH
jgi:hypothetical protein